MRKEVILIEIDELWSNFLLLRSAHPHMRPEHIGMTSYESAPYYRLRGLNFRVHFENPLTMEGVITLNGMNYWINQSFILRMYSLLEYHQIVSAKIKIRTELDGHEEIDILRRLRKYFAHTGQYNPDDKDQKKLFDRIVEYFRLESYDPNTFPLPIDKVVEIIYKRVKKYVEQF